MLVLRAAVPRVRPARLTAAHAARSRGSAPSSQPAPASGLGPGTPSAGALLAGSRGQLPRAQAGGRDAPAQGPAPPPPTQAPAGARSPERGARPALLALSPPPPMLIPLLTGPCVPAPPAPPAPVRQPQWSCRGEGHAALHILARQMAAKVHTSCKTQCPA